MDTVIFSEWLKSPSVISENVSLCIGVFDGVHLGHQKIFKKCINGSDFPVIMTFDKNPKMAVGRQKNVKALNTFEQRKRLFEKIGFKLQVIIDFSPEIRNLSASEFISLLYTKLKVDKLVVGEDFKLGSLKNQAGPSEIERIMNQFQQGSKVIIIKPVLNTDGEVISSSMLRKLIIEGNLDVVQILLGNSYQLDLRLTPSQSFGGELLIKKEDLNQLVPEQGIYDGVWADTDMKTTIEIVDDMLKVSPISDSFENNRFLNFVQKRG
ncbi:MAG: FAD synthetase family protein [Sphaerochaetaceae bacterium]|nr:FAD synthetase family protein [Sphaerochaetaceae bacterium]